MNWLTLNAVMVIFFTWSRLSPASNPFLLTLWTTEKRIALDISAGCKDRGPGCAVTHNTVAQGRAIRVSHALSVIRDEWWGVHSYCLLLVLLLLILFVLHLIPFTPTPPHLHLHLHPTPTQNQTPRSPPHHPFYPPPLISLPSSNLPPLLSLLLPDASVCRKGQRGAS